MNQGAHTPDDRCHAFLALVRIDLTTPASDELIFAALDEALVRLRFDQVPAHVLPDLAAYIARILNRTTSVS